MEYNGLEQMQTPVERCPLCWCCSSCTQHCGCVAGEEGESSSEMELRVLGIGDSVEVIEAEKCVASFVAGGEMFEDDDGSETSDESNDFN